MVFKWVQDWDTIPAPTPLIPQTPWVWPNLCSTLVADQVDAADLLADHQVFNETDSVSTMTMNWMRRPMMMSTIIHSFYLCCSRFFHLIPPQVLQSTLPLKLHTKMHSAILQSSLISRLLHSLPMSLIEWRRASFIALKSGTSYHGRCQQLASPLRNYLKTKKPYQQHLAAH